MPFSRRAPICAVLFSLALAACTTLPHSAPESIPAEPVLEAPDSTEMLLSRFDSMDNSLQQLCDYQDVRIRAQFAALGKMQDMVQELHTDMRREQAQRQRSAQTCPPPRLTELEGKLVLGRSEWVGITPLGSYFKARLDTGANSSSLTATDITPFERDGENWVRFRLALDKDDVVVDGVHDKEFEARLVRTVRIIQASGSETRPVVSLPLTLGPIEQNVEFTLNDRGHLTYPVLLGRRFMMDIAVIDVSRTYIFPRPEFPGGKPSKSAEKDQRDNDEAKEE